MLCEMLSVLLFHVPRLWTEETCFSPHSAIVVVPYDTALHLLRMLFSMILAAAGLPLSSSFPPSDGARFSANTHLDPLPQDCFPPPPSSLPFSLMTALPPAA